MAEKAATARDIWAFCPLGGKTAELSEGKEKIDKRR
jgi:hypothetical protein